MTGYVAQGREAAVSGELIRIGRGLLGYGGRSKIMARVFPRRDIYWPPALSNKSERESRRRKHESARGSSAARDLNLILSS
jgi:hypothetical protein